MTTKEQHMSSFGIKYITQHAVELLSIHETVVSVSYEFNTTEVLDLPTNRGQIISRARSASGRFLMFSAAKASERTRTLGPTTGTGNEKQRTSRNSTGVPKKAGVWRQRGWFAFEKKRKRKGKKTNKQTNETKMK